jgi:hypothetical protein
MTTEPNPPYWAEWLLRSVLRPPDRESISGDLLEEYREVRHPALGIFRADLWYIKQVLSVSWRLVWPCVVTMTAVTVFSLAIKLPWRYSLVQAPGVSVLDAAVCLWAGCYTSRRTRLVRTGMMSAGLIGILPPGLFLGVAAAREPALFLVPFAKPFIFVILFTVISLAIGFGVVLGALGAAVGAWLPSMPRRTHAS